MTYAVEYGKTGIKFFKYRKSAINFAIKMSNKFGSSRFIEFDENNKVISSSMV